MIRMHLMILSLALAGPTLAQVPAPDAPPPATDALPPATETPPPATDVPPPVPAPAPAPAPPLLLPAPAEFVPPHQGIYGPLIEVAPAHRIAMMEANQAVPQDDPRVVQAAGLLERLTAGYIEDAPRIADLAVRACAAIRGANRPASPLEVLDGALRWKRPPAPAGNVPRRFEVYIARYRGWRLDGGKDHEQAVSLIQEGTVPPAPAPAAGRRSPSRPST